MRGIAIGAAVVALALPFAGTTRSANAAGGVLTCVHLQMPSGPTERCNGQIPSGSEFRQRSSCTFDDPVSGQVVEGRWSDFEEQATKAYPPGFRSEDILAWSRWLAANERAHPEGFRVFKQYCDKHYVDTIAVPLSDPLFDPTLAIVEIERSLVIPPVDLVTVPDQSVWGGLVVNVHAFLGIGSTSWTPLESPAADFLGVPLRVVAIPRTLTFEVDGRTVPCVAVATDRPDSGTMFPPEPPGFRDRKLDPPDDPLPAEPCVWTPRGPGRATVTAAVTYTVRAIYGAGVIVRPDFVRSAAFTVPTVELRAVNTAP